MAMAGAHLILDTGSPVSFARNGSITLGGCEHQVPVDFLAGGPDGLGELLGAPIDGLLGCDLLAGCILDLDCPAGRAHLISGDTSPETPCWLANAIALSFSTAMGVPVAQFLVNGRQASAAIDTGAAICFAAPSLVADTPVIGRHHGFHPAIGRFESDLHLVSIDLGGGASPVDVAAAAAPPALTPLLTGLGLQAILGGDLLMGSEILFDFRAEWVPFCCLRANRSGEPRRKHLDRISWGCCAPGTSFIGAERQAIVVSRQCSQARAGLGLSEGLF